MCDTCGCGDDHQHIDVEKKLMTKNDEFALKNRDYLTRHNICALNFVSSPGSGKTSLLVKTIEALKDRYRSAVIEGDQQTDQDALRIQSTQVPVKQINTGQGCHLDAHGIGHAMEDLKIHDEDFLFIENVGNLVCPASFDLGEAHKVVMLSVTEGEDKPLKYPYMFHASSVMLLNKIDLLPYVDFDLGCCLQYARQVNPHLTIFPLSVKTGEGFEAWIQWLMQQK
ncbi:MAG: hydrogenase nickel incorporation protein HypB [Gammaproteobacteria bacterium]|nr:hydrogenase nickel incorporation protein HypB [Gammaproteobacteria bacterium]MBU2545566.1 hydrogenase nickel incorporation protein HypB [Gammaproteobacteria bacterium]